MELNEWIKQRKYLQENLVYGIEMERAIPRTEREVKRKFKISDTHNKQYGYQRFHYQYDGSVENHNEIILTGEKYTFRELHAILTDFEKKVDEMEGKDYSDTTSNHITQITNNLMPISEDIYKNVYNIVRGFTAGYLWLISGERNRILRPRGLGTFSRWNIERDPMRHTLIETKNEIGKMHLVSNAKSRFTADNNPIGLTLEFRGVDGIRTPSALTALVFLHKAIILKAVDESLNGCIKVEELRGREEWIQNKELYSIIQNGSTLSTEIKDNLKRDAHKLLDYLEPIIKAEQDGDLIINVLRAIADKNIGLRRAEGKDYKHIEKELMPNQIRANKLTDLQKKILVCILREKFDAATITNAKAILAQRFGVNARTIRYAFSGIESHFKGIGYDGSSKMFLIEV
jgi:hypothetical protein